MSRFLLRRQGQGAVVFVLVEHLMGEPRVPAEGWDDFVFFAVDRKDDK
jgi:hypothetical protein